VAFVIMIAAYEEVSAMGEAFFLLFHRHGLEVFSA
jgi:hypothetical protein